VDDSQRLMQLWRANWVCAEGRARSRRRAPDGGLKEAFGCAEASRRRHARSFRTVAASVSQTPGHTNEPVLRVARQRNCRLQEQAAGLCSVLHTARPRQPFHDVHHLVVAALAVKSADVAHHAQTYSCI